MKTKDGRLFCCQKLANDELSVPTYHHCVYSNLYIVGVERATTVNRLLVQQCISLLVKQKNDFYEIE